MTIIIRIDGAKSDEIARGFVAARQVFDAAGVTPLQAATARFDVESWDVSGFPDRSGPAITISGIRDPIVLPGV